MKKEDLIAYIDGQLSAEETAAVEQELYRNPELAEEVAALCRQRYLLDSILAQDGATAPPRRFRTFSTAIALAASLVAVATCAFLYLQHLAPFPEPPTVTATVRAVHGRVLLRRGAFSQRTLRPKMSVGPNDILASAADGYAILDCSTRPGTTITVLPQTRIILLDEQEGAIARLEGNTVEVAASRQAADNPLRLHTRDARIEVLGTRFAVTANSGGTKLNTIQGRVRITHAATGQSAEVVAGEFAEAGYDGTLTTGEAEPCIVSFTLIDADTDSPIARHDPLVDGATVDLAALAGRRITVRANTDPLIVRGVRWEARRTDGNGQDSEPHVTHTQNEQFFPYGLTSNIDIDYTPWAPVTGSYEISATPYVRRAGQEVVGPPARINIKVVSR